MWPLICARKDDLMCRAITKNFKILSGAMPSSLQQWQCQHATGIATVCLTVSGQATRTQCHAFLARAETHPVYRALQRSRASQPRSGQYCAASAHARRRNTLVCTQTVHLPRDEELLSPPLLA